MSAGLTGALSAVGAVIVLGLGALLFRMVPEQKQKTVAIAMMAVGGLMVFMNLFYSYGVIPNSKPLDIVFIVLLFGGALTAFVGVAFFRQVREAGEQAGEEGDAG